MGGGYSAVLYPGAINEYTDIEISPLEKGMKENIIMHRYTTSQLSYVLSFQGLTPVQSGSSILLYDASGNTAATISAPYMYDASGNYNYDITAGIEPAEGGYRLTYYMDETWLENAAYPVTLDPSIEFSYDYDYYKFIENSFVSSKFPDQTASQFAFSEQALTAGLYQGGNARAYLRMVFPDSLIETLGNAIIEKLELHLYIIDGGGDFTMHQVTGGPWSASNITWNNAPSFDPEPLDRQQISIGWTAWDLTRGASNWFNSMVQYPNYGICMQLASGTYGSVALGSSLHDFDQYGYPAYYTITYYEASDPGLKLTAHGNGANTGTGYVDLNWDTVEGASNYYVGIFNGKNYEYFYVGNKTSWSTKGLGIWPTQDEISAGRYALHGDKSGSELPMIPASTYANAGAGYENSPEYYFTVIPANAYGQAPRPANFASQSVRLPDTVAPSAPESVSISPSDYTNADEITVNWSGTKDYNASSPAATSSMGSGGSIQYALDNSTSWENTGSTEGTGSCKIDISGLADGQHYVYIRGMDSAGNTGAGQYAYFTIDRTAPTAPTLSITPSDWTKQESVSITWSGITDTSPLDRVEYSIDGKAYVNTGKTEAAYSGYDLDISDLSDGEHVLSLRGLDAAGNEGDAATVIIKKDTSAPSVTDATLSPGSWTGKDSVTLSWTDLEDAHSGMKLVWYCIDAGNKVEIGTDRTYSLDLNISALSDGEHTMLLHFEDNAGNAKEQQLQILRDVSKPELAILAPRDGSTVNGTVEILGSIKDISLDSWKLIAQVKDGSETILASGSDEKNAQQLAVLNCADFEDGEEISLCLEAWDKAGNSESIVGAIITVDKSAKPVPEAVTITSPENNTVIREATVAGTYTAENEQRGMLYVDGVYSGDTGNGSFSFDAIRYPEGSSHSLSLLSLGYDGELRFSGGLSSTVLISEVNTDISEQISLNYAVLAIMLSVIEDKEAGGEISYFYSTDEGGTWVPIVPDTYVPMLTRPESIQLKAEVSGSAVVAGWTLTGVFEASPLRLSVKLQQDAGTIAIDEPQVTKALTLLTEEPEDASALYMFREGEYLGDSFTYDARANEDGSVALLAMLSDGTICGTGAKTETLLRENVNASGTIESGALSASGSIYALRLEALTSTGGGAFSYSTDGESWTAISPGKYIVLDKAAEQVYIKAETGAAQLIAWHLEGLTLTEQEITAELVKAPQNVTAADWSKYYANRGQWRYDLSWTDPSPADDTAEYTTSYEIYRNGTLLATVSDTKYTDTEYVVNAVYQVRTVRDYGEGFTPKASEMVQAQVTVMQPPAETPLGVNNTAEEQKQGEYLDELYGGNYIFATEEKAPTDERKLINELLGKNKYCGYGFEPINFNSGNFILETVDGSWADQGQALLSLDRTYNAQSEAANGPFGEKWESAWTEHLRLYDSGEIVYAAPGGANIVFTPRPDGSYTGGETYDMSLRAETDEYQITDEEGIIHAFTGSGLLSRLQWPDGSCISLERDEKGLLTALVLPSGKKIDIESDKDGHVTSIATLGGSILKYEYQGNRLVGFTDANGN